MISSPTDMIDFGVAAPPPASSEGDLNIASFVLEVRNRLSRLESAHAEISRLRAALAESESARQALEAQISCLSAPPVSSSSAAAPPPPPQPPKAISFASVAASSSAPPVSAPSRSSSVLATTVSAAPTTTTSSNNGKKGKKKSAAPPPPSIKRATATVSRLFGPQSDIPSGYQFVYMSIARRRPLQEIRRTLQGININKSRVLDIQYPIPNVVSFLVHHDYVMAVLLFLTLIPVIPKIYWIQSLTLSPSLRAEKAVEIENLRCLRALSFVHRSVRLSVARSFLFYDKITQKQFDAILAEELSLRAAAAPPPAPSATVAQDRLAKKQRRLSYLSNLLYFDSATAKSLAYTESPALSSSSAADTDLSEINYL
ncbi:hypothetical protein PS6_011678 [Mucor atramentarius]